MSEESSYTYLGDLSSVEPWNVRQMFCDVCMVSWGGCWDAFECPKCGAGELPWHPQLEVQS